MYLKELTLVFLLSGCAGAVKIPVIELCTIINEKVAQCTSTDLSVPSRDIPISRMIGYTAFSPENRSKVSAFIKKLLAAINSMASYVGLIDK